MAGARQRALALVVVGAIGLLAAARAPAGIQELRYDTVTIRAGGEERRAQVPEGCVFEVLCEGLDQPRLLTFGPGGDLFAGSRGGAVYRFPPPYTSPQVLVRLPDYPHSVAFRDGEILIACTEGLFRASYRPGQEQIPKASVERLASLPGGGGHSSRTVGVGPDGRIYVSLGIAGNCSDQYLGENYPFEDRRGGVFVLIEEKVRAPRWEPFAAGLRNPVGFAWQPGTGVLYASNNGPDHWGFELPPEAFSRLVPGSFHGMPWFQWDGKEIRRDACIRSEPPRPAADVSVPVATFPARSAPMGVAFVPKGALLSALEGDAVVAIHGSWATKPGGTFFGDPATRRPPAVDVVRFEGTGARRVDALVGGFQLSSGNRWARPVGVAFGSDGALYFSSDEGVEGILRLRPANAAPSLGPGGS